MNLEEYFAPHQIKRTLLAHRAFVSRKPEWRYQNRFALYPLADIAFSGNSSKTSAEAFFSLFMHLRAHWQLIRPAKRFMPCENIYKLIRKECKVCSVRSPITLRTLHSIPNAHKKILHCLIELKDIKKLPTNKPSIMAISKLLHFYNPNLFLIYDWRFIETGLLKEFASEWELFSNYPKAQYGAFDMYVKYLYFANALLRGKTARLKRAIKAHLGSINVQFKATPITQTHAVIFEFAALGALHREAGYRA